MYRYRYRYMYVYRYRYKNRYRNRFKYRSRSRYRNRYVFRYSSRYRARYWNRNRKRNRYWYRSRNRNTCSLDSITFCITREQRSMRVVPLEGGSEARMMVPESRKKLERFLRDQVKEMQDFVKETDENRFHDIVEESRDSEEEMEVD